MVNEFPPSEKETIQQIWDMEASLGVERLQSNSVSGAKIWCLSTPVLFLTCRALQQAKSIQMLQKVESYKICYSYDFETILNQNPAIFPYS